MVDPNLSTNLNPALERKLMRAVLQEGALAGLPARCMRCGFTNGSNA